MQEAVLIMESQGITAEANEHHSRDFWSRLYRLDHYFLDMTCTPKGEQSQLEGKLLTLEGDDIHHAGQVSLLNEQDQEIAQAQLDDIGLFSLNVDIGNKFKLKLSVSVADTETQTLPL